MTTAAEQQTAEAKKEELQKKIVLFKTSVKNS
jgi:hypothetical protein